MDTRSFRTPMLAAALLAALAAHAGDHAATTTPDAFAPARQGLRWVTQLIRLPVPLRQPSVPVITTGVRG